MSRLTTKIDENDYCFSCSRNNFYYGNGSKEITNKLGKLEDILEEYGIDSIEELELIMQENQKYKHLKYELGCPIEICLKIMLNKIREITINYSDCGGYGSIYSEYITADISSIYYDILKGIIIETNICEVPIKDYKVNWFLKGDLSE